MNTIGCLAVEAESEGASLNAGITAELSNAYTAPASDRTARIMFRRIRSAP
jgi:hypothetical protein